MSKITAESLGIKKTLQVRSITVACPKGGYKNTRIVKRKVSLASVPGVDDPEPSPRDLRRK
jgi:hypothetical protein